MCALKLNEVKEQAGRGEAVLKEVIEEVRKMQTQQTAPQQTYVGTPGRSEGRDPWNSPGGDPWTSGQTGGGGGGGAPGADRPGYDPRRRGLCNARDLEVTRLPEKMSREEFILWRDQLEELLEQSPGWKGISKYTRDLRNMPGTLNNQAVLSIIDRIGGRQTNAGVIEMLSDELYGLLKLKHNTATNSLCKDVDDRNGFELYRLMSREFDPRAEGTDMALLDQVMSMGKKQAKNFDETYLALRTLKRLVDEYNKCQPDKNIEDRIKCWAAWALLDPATMLKADARAELKPAVRTYQAIRNFVDELYVESLSTQLYSKMVGRGDAMDIGGIKPTGCDAPGDDGTPSAKYSYEERMQYWNSAPSAWMGAWSGEAAAEDNHVDAFNGKGGGKGGAKGKGKGKGGKGERPPLKCNRCLGLGHPERVCATLAGSTSKLRCTVCSGVGHDAKDCTSYGGGKYLPPSQRPRAPVRGVSAIDDAAAGHGATGTIVQCDASGRDVNAADMDECRALDGQS